MHLLGSKFSPILRFLAIFALFATVWNGSAWAQTIIAQGDSARSQSQIVVSQKIGATDSTPAKWQAVDTLGAPAAKPTESASGEANLVLPDLSTVSFMGMDGHSLLMIGLIFCALGLLFGLSILRKLKNMPVHRSMREISELIYETCKTYLITQGKFFGRPLDIYRDHHWPLFWCACTYAWASRWTDGYDHSPF
jgi:hypothetical protein